jgi:hypothetical protein
MDDQMKIVVTEDLGLGVNGWRASFFSLGIGYGSASLSL